MSRSAAKAVDLCRADQCPEMCQRPVPPPTLTGEDANEAVGGPFHVLHRHCCPPPMVPQQQQPLYPVVPQCDCPPPQLPPACAYVQPQQQPCVPHTPPSQPIIAIPEHSIGQQSSVPPCWHPEKRQLVFQWDMSLKDLSNKDVIACTEASLTQSAINALGIGQSYGSHASGQLAPAFIAPTKVFLESVYSTCSIPLVIEAPWLLKNPLVVSNGQTGLVLALPGPPRVYNHGDGKVYVLGESDSKRLETMPILYGKKPTDFDSEYQTIQGSPDQIMIPKNTTLYQIFEGIMRSTNPNLAKRTDPGLIITRENFDSQYRQIKADVTFCSNVAPSPSSMSMIIHPLMSSRSTARTDEPQDISKLVRDRIMGISGGDEDAVTYHVNKQFNVIVSLNVEYMVFA